MDTQGMAAMVTVTICIVGGVAFGAWMDNVAAGWFMACALLILGDK